MSDIFSPDYWQGRYDNGKTGWDVGFITPPLKRILDSIEDKNSRILIPGAGPSYTAEYAFKQGFNNVYVCDWASTALDRIKKALPDFPESHLLNQDFFTIDRQFDYMLEQTFFCALPPRLRKDYIAKAATFLQPRGVLTGVMFGVEFPKEGPPFGGLASEYRTLFEEKFHIENLDPCQDSIPSRLGNELFIRAIAK